MLKSVFSCEIGYFTLVVHLYTLLFFIGAFEYWFSTHCQTIQPFIYLFIFSYKG